MGNMGIIEVIIPVVVLILSFFAIRAMNEHSNRDKITKKPRKPWDDIKQPWEDEPVVEPKRTPQETTGNQWISTQTQPPELYKEVSIYTGDKELLHGWARVNDNDYIHSKEDRTINNVTHWMGINTPE